MYKLKHISTILSALTLVMCAPKIEAVDDVLRDVEIVASLENFENENGGKAPKLVKWSGKDAINVISLCGDNAKFTTSERSDEARFYGSVKGTARYAFYPYSERLGVQGGKLTFTMMPEQKYVAGALAPDINPAVALIDDYENVQFKNLCGIFELRLKVSEGSSLSVGSIVLSDEKNPIAGSFSVDLSSARPAAKYARNGESTITLDCGSKGVALSSTPTPFRFVVPAGSFDEGFEAQVYSPSGRLITTISSSEDSRVARNVVTEFDAPLINWIPAGYSELASLPCTGKNFIDTGMMPADGTTYEIVYKTTAFAEGVVMGCEADGGAVMHLANPSANKLVYSVLSNPAKQMVKTLQYQLGDTFYQTVSLNNASEATIRVKKVNSEGAVFNCQTQTVGGQVSMPRCNLYLLASNCEGDALKCFTGELCYVSVTNKKTQKAYYIPCERLSDSKKGVYDLVGKVFLPMQRAHSGGGDVETADPIDLNIENELTRQYWDYVLEHPYLEGDYSYSYMKNYYKQSVSYKKDWPNPAHISWERDTDAVGQTLYVATDNKFENIVQTKTLSSGDSSYDIYNFLPDMTYFYKVVATFDDGDTSTLVMGRVNTSGRRRVIRVDAQVFNVRDFGGLPIGNDKHVRFEQIYRGGRWNGNGTAITQEGKDNLKQVGILAELDLRSQSESEYRTTSPGGDQIEYKRFSNNGNENIFGQYYYDKCNNGDIFIRALKYMIDKIREGKPVYMHCSIGADRTGTLAVLTEGLLGVDSMNICMDWELTSLALVTAAPGDDLRSRYREECSQKFNYQGMWEAVVNNHPGATTQEKFYHYFNKGYKGDGTGFTISKEDLDWFIDYMTVDNIKK